MIIPKNFQICYTPEQIQNRVAELGKDISLWTERVWNDSHTDILAVPILRGGIFFFADLVRSIKNSVEIAPVKVWAYASGENAKQLDKVSVDVSVIPARGRRVLLIDDICDSGRTLEELHQQLLAAGALEVCSAVLIKREQPKMTFSPTWSAFNYVGPEWFVGYGMDDSERWRNLPGVFIIKQG
jgi:hypoxanthine phosphoribosyltransferase